MDEIEIPEEGVEEKRWKREYFIVGGIVFALFLIAVMWNRISPPIDFPSIPGRNVTPTPIRIPSPKVGFPISPTSIPLPTIKIEPSVNFQTLLINQKIFFTAQVQNVVNSRVFWVGPVSTNDKTLLAVIPEGGSAVLNEKATIYITGIVRRVENVESSWGLNVQDSQRVKAQQFYLEVVNIQFPKKQPPPLTK